MPTRESLAAEAFALTARYDTAIARWFAEKGEDFPPLLRPRLREGRRPALRREPAPARRLLPAGRRAHARAVDGPQHHGKQLSFNNLLDLDSARAHGRATSRSRPARSSSTTTRAARRSAATALEAYERAFACDPLSAFGGVIALQPAGRPRAGRGAVTSSSSRCSSRPATTTTRSRSSPQKQNIRILEDEERRLPGRGEPEIHQVTGGLLVQDRDSGRGRARRDGGRHQARADRPGVGRPALRLAGLPST